MKVCRGNVNDQCGNPQDSGVLWPAFNGRRQRSQETCGWRWVDQIAASRCSPDETGFVRPTLVAGILESSAAFAP
jgi:hypothetical protein